MGFLTCVIRHKLAWPFKIMYSKQTICDKLVWKIYEENICSTSSLISVELVP